MRIRTIQDLAKFYEELATEGMYRAEFENSTTVFFSGPSALREYRKYYGADVFKMFSDIPLDDFTRSNDARPILSVGAAGTHDLARCCASETRRPYVTCPDRLTNDSFSTNRMKASATDAAVKTEFPSVVVLDWDLCANIGGKSNTLGLGEAIGLISSARDYASTLGEGDAEELVSFADAVSEDLLDCWCQKGSHSATGKVATLAAFLSLRGLLARVLGTNAAIASCDHLVAYELSLRGLGWPHGRLVFAGVLLTLPVTHAAPEPVAVKLIDMMLQTELMSMIHIDRLLGLDIADVLRVAPERRPLRKTQLSDLTDQERRATANYVKRMLRRYG